MNYYDEIQKNVADIPLLSVQAVQLLELVGHENVSMRELHDIIEKDAVLTGKILNIINSAAFSLARQIHTVEDAVAYLGKKHISVIALESMGSQLFSGDMAGYSVQQSRLWKHSLKTAIAARITAQYASVSMAPGITFTGGILHDIGKSLISSFLMLNNGVEAISDYLTRFPSANFIDIEQKQIGTDHCEVGALLAEHWKLPDRFRDIISHHHNPSAAAEQHRPYAHAVQIGDTIAMMTGTGTGVDAMHYPIDDGYDRYFTISETDLQKIILATQDEFEQLDIDR